MNDENDPRGGRDAELDRIDALISAAMDDELNQVERIDEPNGSPRAELRRLIAEDAWVAARVRAFHRVDAELRGLAQSERTDRLAANFDALSERLADRFGDRFESAEPAPRAGILWLRARALPLAAAAAAALALYLGLAAQEEATGAVGTTAGLFAAEPDETATLASAGSFDTPEAVDGIHSAGRSEFEFAEQLVWALGYVEEGGGRDGQPGGFFDDLENLEDFEIIDQLQVLDYLKAREVASRDREERG